jgi:hypothetical protein
MQILLDTWYKWNPREALAWALSSSDRSFLTESYVVDAANFITREDPRGAAEWAATIPDSAYRMIALRGVARTFAERFPNEPTDWLQHVTDPAARNLCRVEYVMTILTGHLQQTPDGLPKGISLDPSIDELAQVVSQTTSLKAAQKDNLLGILHGS